MLVVSIDAKLVVNRYWNMIPNLMNVYVILKKKLKVGTLGCPIFSIIDRARNGAPLIFLNYILRDFFSVWTIPSLRFTVHRED